MPSTSQRSPGDRPRAICTAIASTPGPPVYVPGTNLGAPGTNLGAIASTPGPPVYVPGTNLGAMCLAPIWGRLPLQKSTIITRQSSIRPSLEKPRGQSLISPSVFASLRLCVRSKDPRGGEGTPDEGFSPRRQARKASDQTSPNGSRHEWHSNAIK